MPESSSEPCHRTGSKQRQTPGTKALAEEESAALAIDDLKLRPIGWIESPLQDKLLIPRQPGLAPSVHCRLRLVSDYAREEAWRGIEGFSYLWLLWHCHKTTGWSPTVRPPRLGGNERVGVFASRSTHRPNPLGLSAVKLLEVEQQHDISLVLQGADLLDGTPIFDVKPYLPYSDALPASGGFAPEQPEWLPVSFDDGAELWLAGEPAERRQQLIELLRQDPRPGYRRGKPQPEKTYGARFAGVDIRWRVTASGVKINKPQPLVD